jgi:hypothetical protein
VPLDEGAQRTGLPHPHRVRSDHGNRPPRAAKQLRGPVAGESIDTAVCRLRLCCRRRAAQVRRRRLFGRRKRHVFGQVEVNRPLRFFERCMQRFRDILGDSASPQDDARLRDRPEERLMVDPHLEPATELCLVQRARERDERRPVEIGAPHTRGEVCRARAERRQTESR